MTNFCITTRQLTKLRPCHDSGIRVRAALKALGREPNHCFSAAEAKEAGCTYDDVIWAASALAMKNEAIKRRLTYFVNDCAIKVLFIYEEKWLDDDRPRLAIRATLDFLGGKIDEATWDRAARDAWAARAARDAWAARAARDARDAWDARAARDAWAAWAAWAARAARAAKRAEFEAWQFNRLVMWLSETSPKPLRLPAKPKRKD